MSLKQNYESHKGCFVTIGVVSTLVLVTYLFRESISKWCDRMLYNEKINNAETNGYYNEYDIMMAVEMKMAEERGREKARKRFLELKKDHDNKNNSQVEAE